MSDDTLKELEDEVVANIELLVKSSSLSEDEVRQAISAISEAEIELESRSNA